MNSHDDFREALRQRLDAGPPGAAAQRRMEPELSYGRHVHAPPADARQAAVALLLYPRDQDWWLPLVVRPATMTDHAGQIGPPGGCLEAGETSSQAALRELEEELGVLSGEMELLGMLSPVHLFVTNFAISPWLMLARRAPLLVPNPAEVQEVLHVPLAWLCQRDNISTYRHRMRGIEFTAPCYLWKGHVIWGATAILLSELTAINGG